MGQGRGHGLTPVIYKGEEKVSEIICVFLHVFSPCKRRMLCDAVRCCAMLLRRPRSREVKKAADESGLEVRGEATDRPLCYSRLMSDGEQMSCCIYSSFVLVIRLEICVC